MSFGSEVRKLRELRGYTQKELADLVEVSQPVIGRLEKSDTAGVQASTMFALCRALDVPCDHFRPFFEGGKQE